jgi:hypothetical protein
MELAINPFIHGRALTPTEFTGRERSLRKIYGLLATGQSIAIIGQPHTGKTSLLKYVFDPNQRQVQTGGMFERDCFIFLDAQMLRSVETQTDFWQLVFEQLDDHLKACEDDGLDRQIDLYRTVVENQFGTFELGQFFAGLSEVDIRLILLLDEFDVILSHPKLNSVEFYGGLRALASHSGGLIVSIAARLNIGELNSKTEEIKPIGSPYFNIFTQLELGPLSKIACAELLERAGSIFTDIDRRFIHRVSGRHAYLFQSAAASLWDVVEEGKEGEKRYLAAGKGLYRQSKFHFADTWRVWSNATRKAITAIALSQIPQLLAKHDFQVSELIDNLDDFSPELDNLETVGVIVKDEAGEWRITQESFLWWLADELRRNVRDDAQFGDWLRAQEFDNLLTANERKKLNLAVRKVLDLAERGATTLIESLAKGFGEGYSRALTGG